MNAATLVTLLIVILIVGFAAWRTYRMVRTNDMCAFCDHKDGCCCGNPINCTIRKE